MNFLISMCLCPTYIPCCSNDSITHLKEQSTLGGCCPVHRPSEACLLAGPSLPASSPGGMSGTSPGALQRPAWAKPPAQATAQHTSTPGAKPQAWGVTPPRQQSSGPTPAAQPPAISWLEPAALSSHGQVNFLLTACQYRSMLCQCFRYSRKVRTSFVSCKPAASL